jgi:hypothetical protein
MWKQSGQEGPPSLGRESRGEGSGTGSNGPFDHGDFVPPFVMPDFIHKCPHQQQAPATGTLKIGRVCRVQKGLCIESRSFIPDHVLQPFLVDPYINENPSIFIRGDLRSFTGQVIKLLVVFFPQLAADLQIPMIGCIEKGFFQSHAHSETLIFAENPHIPKDVLKVSDQ